MKSTDKIRCPESYWCAVTGIRNHGEVRELVLVGGLFRNAKNLWGFDGMIMDILESFDKKLNGVSN